MARAASAIKPVKSVKEATWVWEGTDRGGKRIKGEMMGPSQSAVRLSLRRQGINPIRVAKKLELFGLGSKSIKAQDIAVFSRQLATMMTAGVPLVQALEIIGRGHNNKKMSEMVLAIKANSESGRTFAEALAVFPVHFDNLYVNLVAAGERSGTLETLLEKIATYKEKTEQIKRKVRKAMIYPSAVVVVGFIVTGIMLYFVVPQFAALFEGFGADLPAFTQMVIAMSEFVQQWWWLMGAVLLGTIVLFIYAKKRSPRMQRMVDRVALRLPVVGDILYKSAVARYHRTLSTMFAAGVPLVEAMGSVASASGNIVFQDAILQMRENVSTGQQLQLAMQQTSLFPPMAIQMVAIGEESGQLDTMCAKVAEFYEDEVDALVDALTTLLEPIIMSILGILVGGLVIAMYLPIFKLGMAI